MIFRDKDLYFDDTACLRAACSLNKCDDCLQSCTANAISVVQDRIKLDYDKCTSCGACVGVCRPSALTLNSFNIPVFVIWAASQKKDVSISCDEIGVCLSVFKSDYLASIALRSEHNISLDLTKCETCEYNLQGRLSAQILNTLYTTNSELDHFDKIIKANIAKNHTRRDFLSKIASAKRISEDFASPIKQPAGRMFALSIKEPTDDVFKTMKFIDIKSCNGCNDCATFCPTNALESIKDGLEILHRPSECIACEICVEVCEPDAMFTHGATLKEFVGSKVLVKFEHKKCVECGVVFTTSVGEDKCDVCGKFTASFPNMFKTASELE